MLNRRASRAGAVPPGRRREYLHAVKTAQILLKENGKKRIHKRQCK